MVKKANLYPHLTVMIGYPWETKKDILKTLNFVKNIFKKGLADSLQATIIVPYPGTPLFAEAKKRGWLKSSNWSNFDMRQTVLKTSISQSEMNNIIRAFYKTIFTPKFIIRKIKEGLIDLDNFKYYVRLGLKFSSKLLDFSN
jgi:radical SAM superfamily enzyme YgiQ (UPF0313 family)